jgi:cysteine desulfurase
MATIYLDNHASTPLDPRVLEAMLPWLGGECGNPSSRSHRHGWRAEEAVENARAQVADLIGARPQEMVFTSGATESNNTVLKGVGRDTVVTTAIEHKSILATCDWLVAKAGREIRIAGVDACGIVEADSLFDLACDPSTTLVTIMAANNEVGTIQPIGMVGRQLSQRGFLVHSDAAQAIGRISFDVRAMGLSFASLSAHKMHGPKGIGALFVADDVSHLLTPLAHGGGQERGLRSGTLNVPAIVGFGKACEIAKAEMSAEAPRIARMRDRLEAQLADAIPGLVVHGANRLPGNLNAALPCRDMGAFMAFVSDGVSLSVGSACMSNDGMSHVLAAMGVGDDESRRTIRIGVGRFNTDGEIALAADAIARALDKANAMG